MNTEHFIARRILSGKAGGVRYSRPIIRIAIFGIVLGIAVVIVSLCIVTGFQKEIRDKVSGFGSHIQVSAYDNNESYEPSPISLHQEFVSEINSTPGIRHIQAYATKAGILKANMESEGVVLKGVDMQFDPSFFASCLEEGEIPVFGGKGTARQMVISRLVADRMKLSTGDTIPFFFVQDQKQRVKKLVVAGIYNTGMSGQFDDVLALSDLRLVQELNGWDSTMVGGFEIAVEHFEELDAITEWVNSAIPYDLRAYSIRQVHQTIFSWLDAQDINAVLLIALIVIVCCINMISAILILILERTGMIGILKALGATNTGIRKIFLYNAFYLTGVGFLLGNLLGVGFCALQQHYKFLSLDPESYFLSSVPIHLDWIMIALLNGGAMAFCMIMMLLPSYLVTRITPIRSIRFR
ncbi:MAG: ABC transporter permease [Bacteroidia bacterium]|nr:ABC transporter permease [Bacteroidia bacterium]